MAKRLRLPAPFTTQKFKLHTHTYKEGVPCVCVGLVCRCVSVCCCLVVLFLGICTWVNGHLAVTQYAAHEDCNQCAGYFHSPRHIVVATRYMSIILLYIYNCLFTGLISSLFVQSLLLFFVGLWGILLAFLSWFHLPYGRFRARCTCCGSADAITSTVRVY